MNNFPQLSEKIAEGLAAGVSREKIDLILEAMSRKPELRNQVLALASQYDLRIKTTEKPTIKDNTNTKPINSSAQTKFNKQESTSYKISTLTKQNSRLRTNIFNQSSSAPIPYTSDSINEIESNRQLSLGLLSDEIKRTDLLNSSQFSQGIKLPVKEPSDSKIYPIATITTPIPHNTPIKEESDLPVKKVSVMNNHVPMIYSFDTETTGLDVRKAGIWQYGLARFDPTTGQILGGDVHSNPGISTKLSSTRFFNTLRDINGIFSKEAAAKGYFNTITELYRRGSLKTQSEGLEKTLGKIQLGNILVMQNINFENNLLKHLYTKSQLKHSMYNDIKSKMLTSTINGTDLGNDLFQRPGSVMALMREADYLFTSKFLRSGNKLTFSLYTNTLNKVYDEYNTIIKNVSSNSKVPVIELMDISKVFYANLAEKGLIDRETAQLGLNVDFLTRSLFRRPELHTAFSDAKDTIEIYQVLDKHIQAMLTNIEPSKELKELANTIKINQADEVNKKFLSSVRSTLNDFLTNNYTKVRNDPTRYYAPALSIINNETGVITTLDEISIGRKNVYETNLESALTKQLENYNLYKEDLGGLNRTETINRIVQKFKDTNDVNKAIEETMLIEKGLTPTTNLQPTSIINPERSILGSTFNKNNKTVLGIGLVAGLGYMAFKSTRFEKEDPNENLPVSYQFYDEQYLGTGFVEFRERNKRYMY